MNHSARAAASFAAATFLLASCAAPGYEDPDVARPAPNTVEAPPLADVINATGYDIFHAVAATEDGDVVLSPLSIGTAFGMLDVGATGSVSQALEKLFGFPGEGEARWSAFNALTQGVETEPDPPRLELDPEDDGWYPQAPIIRIANRLFQDKEFEPLPSYPENLARWFGAGIEPLDMRGDPGGARGEVNRWVDGRTEGLIPELLPDGAIHADTVLVLVNAIYILADWQTTFDAADTAPADFTRLDGSTTTVDLMHEGNLLADAVVADGYSAVELPYAGGDLSMLVIVPDAGNYAAIERSLGTEFVASVDASLADSHLTLYLPSFESGSSIDLGDVIEGDLGVTGLFDVEDLGGIGPNLAVDRAIHAAEIRVDENGTEAAAATAITIELTSMPAPPDFEIRADRPFLYLVRDESTGAVLFLGRVLNPGD